jgi:arginine decarboxylase
VSAEELKQRPGVTGVDPRHVLIDTSAVGLTGYQADDWLREERQIDVELADHRRIMPRPRPARSTTKRWSTTSRR